MRCHALALHPAEQIGEGLLLAGIGHQFAQRQRRRFRLHRLHHRALLRRCVLAERLGGDLDDEPVADCAADRRDGVPIGRRIEQVTAVGVAHMGMDHRRACLEAMRGRHRQLRRRQRHGGMVGLDLAAAVGGDRNGNG